MRYIFYLNLWGTLEKLRGSDDSDTLFARRDLARAQARFAEVLLARSKTSPKCRVLHLPDSAYAVCSDVDPLLEFAAGVFQDTIRDRQAEFHFWPLRGAIACDRRTDDGIDLMSQGSFHSLRLDGEAPVEAAHLEKSAQKGARLFLTEAAANGARALRTRECETRGVRHVEANWMSSGFLTKETLEFFSRTSKTLFERGGNYPRQMGASLDDLTEWARMP